MVSFAPTSKETLADQARYTGARMVQVACLDCLARVRVKKNSEHHTSIQWDADAQAACREFRRMESRPGGRKVHVTCPRLRSSIDRAVDDGTLQIGAEDGW